MKANELMIGDLVYLGKTDIVVIVVAVSADGDDTILVKYQVPDRWGKYGEMVGPNDIIPIPLTPEILKKNGFKDSEFFGELLYKDWQIMSDCEHLAARCKDGRNFDILCKFVHELQHALRLAGIEKEIEL